MSETTAYQKFAEMMLHKESQVIPKILQCMITDEQAEMLVSLPGTAAQMAEKSGRKVDAVRNDLNDMFRKGLALEGKRW
jgi:predicted transcriptional regulator